MIQAYVTKILRRGTTAALDNAQVFIDYQVSRYLSLSISNPVFQKIFFTFRGRPCPCLVQRTRWVWRQLRAYLWATIVATEMTFVAVAAQSACRVNVKMVLCFKECQ